MRMRFSKAGPYRRRLCSQQSFSHANGILQDIPHARLKCLYRTLQQNHSCSCSDYDIVSAVVPAACSRPCILQGAGALGAESNSSAFMRCTVISNAGPAAIYGDGLAHILYAPNTSEVVGLTETLARALACPADYRRGFLGTKSFPGLFHLQDQPRRCADQATCMADSACWQPLHEASLQGFASEADALAYLADHQELVDAMVVFDTHDADAPYNSSFPSGGSSSSSTASSMRGLAASTAPQTSCTQQASGKSGRATLAVCPQAPGSATGSHIARRDPSGASFMRPASVNSHTESGEPAGVESFNMMQDHKASAGTGNAGVPTKYTIRANSSDPINNPQALPTTRQLIDPFSNPVLLPEYYKRYWFFVNLQLAVDRSILGHALAANISGVHSQSQGVQHNGFQAAEGSMTGSSQLLGVADPQHGSNMTMAEAAGAGAADADAEHMAMEVETRSGIHVYACGASRQLEEASAAVRAFAGALGATGPSITYMPRPMPIGANRPHASTDTSRLTKRLDRCNHAAPRSSQKMSSNK